MTKEPEIPGRRPLASRQWPIMQRTADWLIVRRVPPNAISVGSAVFGIVAGCCLAATSRVDELAARVLYVAVAGCIQARLLANLFDGMVAVGSGQRSPVGELYNEVPDRISDAAIFVGAGYSFAAAPWLGYAAAVSAVFVAYVRAVGVVAGAGQCFLGPMAKPQRMFVMTLFALTATIFPRRYMAELPGVRFTLVDVALTVVFVGCLITSVRRLLHIGGELRGDRR